MSSNRWTVGEDVAFVDRRVIGFCLTRRPHLPDLFPSFEDNLSGEAHSKHTLTIRIADKSISRPLLSRVQHDGVRALV